jgi:hypothetical protein
MLSIPDAPEKLEDQMAEVEQQATQTGSDATQRPTLYVCHGDEGGPRVHPCRRVQEAMHEAGIDYEKIVAAHGNPIPFLRKGSREQLRTATGDTKLPTLKLADGTVIKPSRKILAWIERQQSPPGSATA